MLFVDHLEIRKFTSGDFVCNFSADFDHVIYSPLALYTSSC